VKIAERPKVAICYTDKVLATQGTMPGSAIAGIKKD